MTLLEPSRFCAIDLDQEGLHLRERDGANKQTYEHSINVVDHGDYINIGCIRVSRAAWDYIVSRVRKPDVPAH